MTLEEIIDFVQAQLDWRGPGGSKQGHIVIARREAEELLKWLKVAAAAERGEREPSMAEGAEGIELSEGTEA